MLSLGQKTFLELVGLIPKTLDITFDTPRNRNQPMRLTLDSSFF